MKDYLLLLPPSEGKTPGGNEAKPYRIAENLKQYNSFHSLNFDRNEIYSKLREALNELDELSVEKVFDVKGKKLQESMTSILDMLNSPTLPAIERFSGVMFKAINYNEMNDKEKEIFNSKVIFIDGLFGLIRPQDLLPEYKLKIASKFLDINVTKFWKLRLSGLFDVLFKKKIIIDILPESHRKVVSKNEKDEYYEIIFMDKKNSKYKQAGHSSKELKGEIVNYLVQFERISRKELEEFNHSSGYYYNSKLSCKNKIVYLKEH